MALDSHIRELGSRHQTLERAIREESLRPVSDSVRLKELKRQKLKLKDEIEGLRKPQSH
jgi:hypothetical protein